MHPKLSKKRDKYQQYGQNQCQSGTILCALVSLEPLMTECAGMMFSSRTLVHVLIRQGTDTVASPTCCTLRKTRTLRVLTTFQCVAQHRHQGHAEHWHRHSTPRCTSTLKSCRTRGADGCRIQAVTTVHNFHTLGSFVQMRFLGNLATIENRDSRIMAEFDRVGDDPTNSLIRPGRFSTHSHLHCCNEV